MAFSVPLVFRERYFLLEAGGPPSLTVFWERDDQPVFEILKNRPVDNALAIAAVSPAGVTTVTERATGRLLYRVRPDMGIVFVRTGGGEICARVSDRTIRVDDLTLENNVFAGQTAGVAIQPDGALRLGVPLPTIVRLWLVDPPLTSSPDPVASKTPAAREADTSLLLD